MSAPARSPGPRPWPERRPGRTARPPSLVCGIAGCPGCDLRAVRGSHEPGDVCDRLLGLFPSPVLWRHRRDPL